MTDTIPNVPRELLETLIEQHITAHGCTNHTARQAQLILCAPSPNGVDGLEVVGYVSQDDIKWQGDCTLRLKPYSDYVIPLCRLSDAAAIIDGLRGEVEVMTQHANNYSLMFEECAEERDHLAQCLKFARTTMAVVANNANLRGVEYRSLVTEVKRIDAALSAVCAAAPNIAMTSEHNGS